MGRSRRSFSTSVHLIGDDQGNPVDIVLTRGQSHESQHLGSLLMGREAGSVHGDRDYDRKPCRDLIAAIGTEAVVPPHPFRKDPAAFAHDTAERPDGSSPASSVNSVYSTPRHSR